jgi:microcystin-dependent protein
MSVATWLATDFTSQDPTTYKGAIDGDFAVARRIVDAFAPHAQSTPNMTVALDAGHVFSGVTLTEVAAQSSGTISAPVSHPRIDRVVISRAAGTLSVITGTENATPSPPAITAGNAPVAQILLQTSTTAISDSMITDERDLTALGRGAAADESLGSDVIDNGGGSLTYAGTGTIASAATCDIGTIAGPVITVSGTTTITSLGDSMKQGQRKRIRATGTFTLTAGTNIVILNGNVTIAVQAGDVLEVTCDGTAGSHNVYYVEYFPAAGLSAVPSGAIAPFAGIGNGFGNAIPPGWLLCCGQSVSRSTYATLFGILCPGTNATMTVASPCVVTINSHGLVAGDPIAFETTGTLPTGLAADTIYYVAGTITTNTFSVAATTGGAAINTTGSQSGAHTCFRVPYGGLTSTNFSLPDLRGRVIAGQDTMGGAAASRLTGSTTQGVNAAVLGASGGEQAHIQTQAELAAHSHTTSGASGASGASSAYQFVTAQTVEPTGTTGSSTAFNVVQPTLATNYIIKT